jgi:PKD repeat protein
MKLILSIGLLICLSIFVMPVLGEEPPFVVDFSANVTSGTAPLPVQFTNLVTGDQISGFWVINNITFNQLPGPDYTFYQPGTYDASLTVTDDTNVTLTETKIGYIIVSSSINTTAFSFISQGIWGSNPIEITDLHSGEIVFVGKTSSRNVMLGSDGNYSVKIEPGGITDVFNSPDYGIVVIANFAKNNVIGLIFFAIIIVLIIVIFRRK